MADISRIEEFRPGGFNCGQVLLNIALDNLGKQNPDLIRSMQALGGGLGSTGNNCGALIGGVCLLGLYAGKGVIDQPVDERLNLMVADLVEWFQQEYGSLFGGINCNQLLQGDNMNIPLRCPGIIMNVYQKTEEILLENGYDLTRSTPDY